MEICGLGMPVARRDFMATRAAALRDYAGLAVLFNTTAAAFVFSRKRCVLETIIRQPDCVFAPIKQVLVHTESSDSDVTQSSRNRNGLLT
jgi:hypothetical protein